MAQVTLDASRLPGVKLSTGAGAGDPLRGALVSPSSPGQSTVLPERGRLCTRDQVALWGLASAGSGPRRAGGAEG